MKTPSFSHAFLAGAALLIITSPALEARRVYGVSNGNRAAVATPRGVAVAGPNGAAAVGRRGAVAVGPNGAAAVGRYGAAAVGPNRAVVATRPVVRPLPRGYIHTVPVGYRRIMYRGYNCFFAGGIYYRAVMYEGATVYVVVN